MSVRPAITKPADFGPHQMADHLGAYHGQIDRARELGLLPEPDADGRRWSAALVGEIRARWPQILAGIEAARELGAARCAALLTDRTGLDVDRADVDELAGRGLAEVTGSYKEWPLYRVAGLEDLAADPAKMAVLAQVVAERKAWLAASLDRREAAARLGWQPRELDRVLADRNIRPGRFGRYALAGLESLAGDEDLAGQIRQDRLLMTHQAAAHLEIRETDFKYLLAGDLIAPKTHTTVQVSRYRWADVPLYRAGDLEALHGHPDIDWEAVWAARPGSRRRCVISPAAPSTGPPSSAAGSPNSATGSVSRYGPGGTTPPAAGKPISSAPAAAPPSRSSPPPSPGTRPCTSTATRSRWPPAPAPRSAGPGRCTSRAPRSSWTPRHRPGRIHRRGRRHRRSHRRHLAGHPDRPGLPSRARRPVGARDQR